MTLPISKYTSQEILNLVYDPDSRFAGLLFFWDAAGKRQMVTVDAPLIPTFI